MGTVTITFRAKRTEFAGGWGYKVPRIRKHHLQTDDIQLSRRIDTAFKIARNGTVNSDWIHRVTGGFVLPGIIWETPAKVDTESAQKEWAKMSAWVVEPVGNGFMADVSITIQLA